MIGIIEVVGVAKLAVVHHLMVGEAEGAARGGRPLLMGHREVCGTAQTEEGRPRPERCPELIAKGSNWAAPLS
jgi:hypothetical protein